MPDEPRIPQPNPYVAQIIGEVVRHVFARGEGDLSKGAAVVNADIEQADKLNQAMLREMKMLNANLRELNGALQYVDDEGETHTLLDAVEEMADLASAFSEAFPVWWNGSDDHTPEELLGVLAGIFATREGEEMEGAEPGDIPEPE